MLFEDKTIAVASVGKRIWEARKRERVCEQMFGFRKGKNVNFVLLFLTLSLVVAFSRVNVCLEISPASFTPQVGWISMLLYIIDIFVSVCKWEGGQ
jgi:hypothetical protein